MSIDTLNLSSLYSANGGGLVVLQSHAGQGRSRYAQHLIYEERKQGVNTLFLSSDLGTLQAHAMQVSKHMYVTNPNTALSDNQILHKQYDIDQAAVIHTALLDMDSKGFGHFRAEYRDEITVDNLEAILEAIWDEGQHFDVVVIDSLSMRGNYTFDKVLAILNQIAKTFKGRGFKGLVTFQLAKEVSPESIKEFCKKSIHVNYTALTLNKAGDTTYVYLNMLTVDDVINKREALEANYGFCTFNKNRS